MIQDIITSAIIAASAGVTVYNFYSVFFRPKAKKLHHCAGCAGCNLKIHVNKITVN